MTSFIDPESRVGRLAETTLELCAIPSVTGDEAEICDHVLEAAARLAPGIARHRVGHSAILLPPRRPGRPTIGLFGHLDTVKPADDQPLEIDGGRVYGCGASDMKGALAVMLELLAEASTFEKANVVFVFYDKEEGPMLESGMIPVLASGLIPHLDMAICLEPTDNRIQAGCVGSLHAEVTIRGRRAHSARPWQGDNAVYRALPLLDRIAAFGRKEVVVGGLPFFEVMNVTRTWTENSRNVVPDRLMLNVNYRFAPGKSVEQATADLEAVVLGGSIRDEVPEGVDLEVIDEAPSGAVYTDHPLLSAWQREQEIPLEPKQAWTDVARLTAAGIPAINFGPGETAQAHQARESVPVPMLEAGYRLLRALF